MLVLGYRNIFIKQMSDCPFFSLTAFDFPRRILRKRMRKNMEDYCRDQNIVEIYIYKQEGCNKFL